MRNKSKRVLAIMAALMIAGSSVAATSTVAFADETTPGDTSATKQEFSVVVDPTSYGENDGYYTYDGTAKTPTLKFYVGGQVKIMTLNVDYTVDVQGDNKNVGTFNLVVKGIGEYTGTYTLPVTIKPAKFLDSHVANIADVTYDGTAKTPTVTLTTVATNAGLTLDDLVLTYSSNNVNATEGTNKKASVTVTVKDGKNYTGSITKYFNINQVALTADNVETIENQVFTGSKIEPEVVVKADLDNDADSIKETTLVKGVDYDVTYGSDSVANIKGTGLVTVTPKGNYKGTAITKNFSITDTIAGKVTKVEFANPQATYNMANIPADGNGFTPEIIVTTSNAGEVHIGDAADSTKTVLSDGSIKVKDSSTNWYAIYSNNKKAGTASVTVGHPTYAGKTDPITFTIDAAKVTVSDTKNLTDTYNYNPLVPVTFTAKELFQTKYANLVEGTDYTVTYENNNKAGEAKLTINFIGAYASSDPIVKTFTINKADH